MPLEASEFAELIRQHAGALVLWTGWRSLSPEDIVQEAFCRLAVEEPAPDRPVAWLYRVCRNLAAKEHRSGSRRRAREAVYARPEASPSDPAQRLELADVLAAVERLDEEMREVLVARIWGGLSLEEIGKLCGVSTATACRRYRSAIQALQAKLAPACENRP